MYTAERLKRNRSVKGSAKAIVASCVLIVTAMLFTNMGSAVTVVRDIGDLDDDPTGGMTILVSTLAGKAVGPYEVIINDLGQITGLSFDSSDTPHIFVWDESVGMIPIGTGGHMEINNAGQVYYSVIDGAVVRGAVWQDDVTNYVSYPGSAETRIIDMNDVGTAVGCYLQPGGWYGQAFRKLAEGDMESLGFLPGYDRSSANGVNSFDWTVGHLMDESGTHTHACVWGSDDIVPSMLEWAPDSACPGSCSAYIINNQYQIMGLWRSEVMAQLMEGSFYWTQDTGMLDLGCLPGLDIVRTDAVDMNENGVIVGTEYSDTNSWAFVWEASTEMVALPSFDSVSGGRSAATSINDASQIVGWCIVDGFKHACLWEFDALSSSWMIRDLGTLGGVYSEAYGINNKGEVACMYKDLNGDLRVFYWKSLTAQEASGDLVDDIKERVGDENAATGMTAKVGAAQNQMDRDNDKSAVAILEALIHQIEAQVKAGKVSAEDGAYLIAQTQAIIDDLMAPTV